MQPLISVIVPVYNGEAYLKNCIESIEQQTYRNLEILIINDGSTDHTEQVCRDLTVQYQNLRIFELKDEGVSAARNKGLCEAKGEFVTFVDADDRILPRMLENLYEQIEKSGCDITGCGFLCWSWESQLKEQPAMLHAASPGTIWNTSDYIKEQLLQGNSRCWSKLYRRSCIGDIRFRKGLSIGEDMLFLLDLMPYVSKLSETQYKGYGYYQNPEGAMNRAFLPQYMDQIICWEIAREEINQSFPEYRDQVSTVIMIAIMLTAAKLALLTKEEREQNQQYITICRQKVKTEKKNRKAYKGLTKGYRFKVRLLSYFPSLYFAIYHLRKYKR